MARDTESLVRRCEVALRWAKGQNRTYLTDSGFIRIRRPEKLPPCCPIILACEPESHYSTFGAWQVGERHGFGDNAVRDVISAADGSYGADPETRTRLLVAAGLS